MISQLHPENDEQIDPFVHQDDPTLIDTPDGTIDNMVETRWSKWFGRLLVKRHQHKEQLKNKTLSKATGVPVQPQNQVYDKQRDRALRDAKLISLYSKLNPVYLIALGMFVLLFIFLGYSGSTYINMLMLEVFVSLLGMLLLGYAFMNKMFRRMRTVSQDANAADINILIHGSGISQNLVGNKPLPYDLDTSSFRTTLLRVLPTLRDSDAELISAHSHSTLSKALQMDDKFLALAVLNALPHIGTQSALPYVEALMNGQMKLGRDANVRSQATGCYGLLKERVASQNTKTLLRASQPKQNGEELLRSVGTTPITNSEQLLRASQTNKTK